jgi:hypothetical protein
MLELMQPISFVPSRRKLVRHVVTSAAFVATGIFMWSSASTAVERWVAISCVLLFGIAAIVLTRRMFEAQPRITLDDTGLFDRTLGVGTIPWCEITDARITTIWNVQMVSLVVRDPRMWTRKYGPIQQVLAKFNRSLGFSELNLATTDLNVKAHDLLALIQKRIKTDTRTIDRKYQDNRTF